MAARRITSKPLAPSTYLLRNWGRTAPLIAVILLAVLLIAGIVAMMDSIPLSIRTTYSYSKFMLAVSTRGDVTALPKIKQAIETHAPVPIERVVTCRATSAMVKSIVGKWPFAVLGLAPKDLRYYLKQVGMTELRGRYPEAGMPECVVSEPVATNLKLKIGDALLSPTERERYSPYAVKVVGIAKTQSWVMLADTTYLQFNHLPPLEYLLVFAGNRADQEKLDRWAERAFKGERVQLYAYHLLEKDTREMFNTLYKILDLVIGILVLVITVMMAMLMNIYQSQRLVEFGLLQAIGYTRRQLLSRMFRETLWVMLGGWLLGVLGAYGMLSAIKAIVMDPNAYSLDVLDQGAYLYTIPVPVAVLLAGTTTVFLRFRKFDPVAIVERRLV